MEIFFLFLYLELQATNYFVDITNGNDTNSGTTSELPWKTINKVNLEMSTFSAGDSILFKKGETWKGTRLSIEEINGNASSNILFGAYGTGAMPIISSVVAQSHTWINTGSNIWQAENPPSENPNRMLINGQEKLRANIESELDGVTYFWWYDENMKQLYLYSPTDPNSFTIEYSTDFPVIIGYATYITLRDLDLQGGWTGLFVNTLSKYIHLDSMKIGKYCREGVVVNADTNSSGFYPSDILIENCNFDAFFAFDYSSAGNYSGSSDRGSSDGIQVQALLNGEVKNCSFKNWGHASLNGDGGEAQRVTYLKVHDNFMTSPDICYGGRIGLDDAHYCEYYNNLVFNTSVQSQLNGQHNHYHHNIFDSTKVTPLTTRVDAGLSIQSYATTEVSDNLYENNVFVDNQGPAISISGNNIFDIHDNIFRNNIVYNCGITVSGKSIEVQRNLYAQTYNNSFLHNLVFSDSTVMTCQFRAALYDVAGFNNLSGTDGYVMTDNIAANPGFVDALQNNYHLSAASPCIDNGDTVSADTDFDNVPLPLLGSFDIGAYEYGVFWKGTISNDWHVGANWSDGITPATTDSVTIPSSEFYNFQPEVSSDAEVQKLWLYGNGKLTIRQQATFQVLK